MPQRTINIGTVGNDGTGDDLRTGGDKINQNFTEVYSDISALLLSGTNQAPNAGISFANSGIRFDGTTRDSNLTHTLLNVVDPTGTNVATLPDSTGTIALTSDIRPTIYSMVDSSYVQARQLTFLDSALAQMEFLDSAETLNIISGIVQGIPYNVVPLVDSTFSLGTPTHKWKDLYVSGSTIHLGGIKLVDGGGKLVIKDDATGATISNSVLDSAGVTAIISPEYLSNIASGVTSYEVNIGGISNVDSTWYVNGGGFDSSEPSNPDITLVRGLNYNFVNRSDSSDTLWIKTTPSDGTGDGVTTGFVEGTNGAQTFVWNVPFDAPEILYYKSEAVGGPYGRLLIHDQATFLNTTEVTALVDSDYVELRQIPQDFAYASLTGAPVLATVATSGAYSDLSGTPSLATVATSGAYSDLSGTPTAVSTFTNDADYLDSNTVLGVIDATYIQANQSTSSSSTVAYIQFGLDGTVAGSGGAITVNGVDGAGIITGLTMPVAGTVSNITVTSQTNAHSGGSLTHSAAIYKNNSYQTGVSKEVTGASDISLNETVSVSFAAGDKLKVTIDNDTGMDTHNHNVIVRFVES